MDALLEFHYVWQCQPSSETRGRRLTVGNVTGCSRWNYTSTRQEITEAHKPQRECACSRRPRLTPLNTEYFYSREDAKRVAEAKNTNMASEVLSEHITEHSAEYYTE